MFTMGASCRVYGMNSTKLREDIIKFNDLSSQYCIDVPSSVAFD